MAHKTKDAKVDQEALAAELQRRERISQALRQQWEQMTPKQRKAARREAIAGHRRWLESLTADERAALGAKMAQHYLATSTVAERQKRSRPGGKARAAALTAEQRSAIARKANAARQAKRAAGNKPKPPAS